MVVGWNWIRSTSSDWFQDERRLFCDISPTALFTVTNLSRHREYCVVLHWYLATCVPPSILSLTYRAAEYTWHARDKNEGQSEQRIVTSISVTSTFMHPITVTTLPTLNPSAVYFHKVIKFGFSVRQFHLESNGKVSCQRTSVFDIRKLYTKVLRGNNIHCFVRCRLKNKPCSKLFVQVVKQQTSQSLRASPFFCIHNLQWLTL